MDLKALKNLIESHVRSLDYELYDLEYVKERRSNILRVMIDKKTGIDIDDCVKVSETISALLDETDPIQDDYSLEVSSPGAERKLRNREEIKNAIGHYVHIQTYEQTYEGDLVSFEDDMISIKVKNKIQDISYLDITLIRFAIKF